MSKRQRDRHLDFNSELELTRSEVGQLEHTIIESGKARVMGIFNKFSILIQMIELSAFLRYLNKIKKSIKEDRNMLHESDEKSKVQIYNARVSFEDAYQKDNLLPDLLENIKSADILLLPLEDFKGFKNCFHEQTYQFYSFLKKEAVKHDLSVDIGESDEGYMELELHSDVVNISEVLIQWTLFPIVTGMIASYLYDLIKQRKKKSI